MGQGGPERARPLRLPSPAPSARPDPRPRPPAPSAPHAARILRPPLRVVCQAKQKLRRRDGRRLRARGSSAVQGPLKTPLGPPGSSMPPQACHEVAGWGASRDAAQGRAPWVTGIRNLEIRPWDEGERLKNGTHAGSEESAVLKAASLLEGRPLRPGSPSRGQRNHLPFGGDLQPRAEPRVPAGGGKTCTPGPETVCPEGRKPADCEGDRAGHLGSSSRTYPSDLT